MCKVPSFFCWLLMMTALSGVPGPMRDGWAQQNEVGFQESNPQTSWARLPDPEQDALLEQLLSALAERPDNSGILTELDDLLSDVLIQAEALADEGQLSEMGQLLDVVRGINPGKSGLRQARERHEALVQVEHWLANADLALNSGKLVEPQSQSAAYFYRKVLAIQPENIQAMAGLGQVQSGLIQRAQVAAQEMDFELAADWLLEAEGVMDDQSQVELAQARIANARDAQSDRIEQEIMSLLAQGQFNRAEIMLIDMVALGTGEGKIAVLRQRIDEARAYGNFSPGQVVRDAFHRQAGFAPEVVVIVAGSFLMGSAEGETGASDEEFPQHRVTLAKGFALGRTEVTVGEFRGFIEATGYRTHAQEEGVSQVYDERSGRLTEREGISWRHDFSGRTAHDESPVLHVTWDDAQAYVDWLSSVTGASYRLPSEAEFEYALRGGSTTPYWWGEATPPDELENLTGDGDTSSRNRNWSVAFKGYADGHWGPAPAGYFPANGFGLHDMAGNVSEWVADCWHANYMRAPTDGSAWNNPGCQRRVVRGGYWAGAPKQSRSAARLFADASLHGPRVGFRIARDL